MAPSAAGMAYINEDVCHAAETIIPDCSGTRTALKFNNGVLFNTKIEYVSRMNAITMEKLSIVGVWCFASANLVLLSNFHVLDCILASHGILSL